MMRRRQRIWCLVPTVVWVWASVILCNFILAQPQEKIASVRRTSRKRMDGHRSWNQQEILKVIQRVDLTSSCQTPASYFASAVPVSMVTLPAFLDVAHLSSNSTSSSAATAAVTSRFRVTRWRFLITDKKLSDNTATVRGIAALESGSVAGQRNLLSQNQIIAAPSTEHYRTLSNTHHHHNNKNSVWNRLRDDFSFKGYGISVYKSLMALNKAGIAFRIPLLNHWDWWDSNPALPSIGLMLCAYYPFNLSVGLTSSMRMDVLKCWLARSVLLAQAAVLQLLHHLLSALWIIVSLLLYPLQQKWSDTPCQLDQLAAKLASKSKEVSASYQSEIQERLGTTFWYRWTPTAGFDARISVWHLYMPTLEVYSQFLTGSKERLLGPWWKSHFASLGLDSAVSNAMFSATGVLSLSGLRFNRGRVTGSKPERSVEVDSLTLSKSSANTVKDQTSSRSFKIDFETTKAKLSTMLQEDRNKYDDNELSESLRLQVMRGGNNTAIATNHTTTGT
jgi:hypothetical protein